MKFPPGCALALFAAASATAFAPHAPLPAAVRRGSSASPLRMVTGQQAESQGPAAFLRKVKADLPQFPWLAEGGGNPRNKVDMPDYVREVLNQPSAPRREPESEERTRRIRGRMEEASADAAALKNMLVGEADAGAWWRERRDIPEGGREVTDADPLTVLVTGGDWRAWWWRRPATPRA